MPDILIRARGCGCGAPEYDDTLGADADVEQRARRVRAQWRVSQAHVCAGRPDVSGAQTRRGACARPFLDWCAAERKRRQTPARDRSLEILTAVIPTRCAAGSPFSSNPGEAKRRLGVRGFVGGHGGRDRADCAATGGGAGSTRAGLDGRCRAAEWGPRASDADASVGSVLSSVAPP